MENALSGIRVLDFSRVLAGPLCTMMLADLGAEVIKVESPIGGDDTRQWGPPWVGELSAYFASVNRNKRSITLNLKHAQGQAIARQLANQSHVVVENFKVGQMAGFGLDYASLRESNPALVYCSITGFGQTGQYRERPGYDYVVQAMSGLMSITGEVEGEPAKVGVAISDVIAGLHAATAVLAALRHSEQTGVGQSIDISLLDTQLAALVNIASNYLVSGKVPQRQGNQHANIVPYQTFHASNGAFVVAVGNDRQFRLLCYLIQQPELCEDERFATNPARVKNKDTLIPLLETVFAEKTSHEWVSLLLDAGIPAGPIQTVAEALRDPHVQERGMVQQVTISSGELLEMVASPLKLSQTPTEITLPPPQHGEHTHSVLTSLGYTAEEFAILRSQGVI